MGTRQAVKANLQMTGSGIHTERMQAAHPLKPVDTSN
jgi:hypothetical protein